MNRSEGGIRGVEPSPAQEHIGIAQPLAPYSAERRKDLYRLAEEGVDPLLNLLRQVDERLHREPADVIGAIVALDAARIATAYRLTITDGSASDRVTEAEDLGTGRRDTNNTSLHSEEKEAR